MSSTSYLRQNSYQEQVFKPFEQTYQNTLQEINTKTAYWQAGAQKIKSQFDAAQGLDPMFAQNKEYLHSFIEKANKELTKAGKSDLSQADNQGAALAIFNPLYDTRNEFNKNLLTDSQTNEFYKKQRSLADAARTTNGGKTWNQNNEFYMNSGYAKYAEDAEEGNINSIGDHWQNKKGYIPYYDYSDDLKEAIKNCHESSSETTDNVNGTLYFQTKSNKGLSQSQVQNCISFMPPQAKQQIGIDSYSNYYNNKEGLLHDYENLVYGNKKAEVDALSAQLSAAKAKNDKKAISEITPVLDASRKDYDNIQKDYHSMLGGMDGVSYLEKNYEKIAQVVGLQHFTERAGKTFAWSDIKNKLSPDAAAIANAHIQADAANQRGDQQFTLMRDAINHQNDLETEKYKLTGKIKGKFSDGIMADGTESSGITPEDILANPESPELTDPEQALQSDIASSYQSSREALKTLKNLISPYLNSDPAAKALYDATGGQSISLDKLINFIDQYEKSSGVKNDRISTQLQVIRNLQSNIADKEARYNNVNIKADAEGGKMFNNTNFLPTNIFDASGRPLMLSEKDLVDIKLGKTVKGISSKISVNSSSNELLGAISALTGTDQSTELYYQGRKISTASLGQAGGLALGDMEKINKYYQMRKQLFQPAFNETKDIFTTGDNVKSSKERALDVKRAIGIGANDDYEVSVDHRNDLGYGYVRVIEKGKGTESNNTLTSEKEYNKFLKTLTNQKIEKVNLGSTDNPIYYLKVPNVYTPLPGYISGANISKIKTFAEGAMSNLASGKTSDNYWNTNSPDNIPVRVSVTNMNGARFYNIEMYDSGRWIERKSSTPLDSEQLVLKYISNIKKK